MSAHPFGPSKAELRERAVSQMLDFYEIIQVYCIERTTVDRYEEIRDQRPTMFREYERTRLEEHSKLQEEAAALIVAQAMVMKGNGTLDQCYIAVRDAV